MNVVLGGELEGSWASREVSSLIHKIHFYVVVLGRITKGDPQIQGSGMGMA